jgi:hypothetical protein
MTARRIEGRLRASLSAALTGQSQGLTFGLPCAVQLCFRHKGKRLARVWGEGAGLEAALHDAVARAALSAEAITHIEITLARAGRLMAQDDLSRARANEFRGLMGIELCAAGKRVRMGPLEMLTRNLGPSAALTALSREIGLDLSAVEARAFPADHPRKRRADGARDGGLAFCPDRQGRGHDL